jgi:hypothetical protein
VSRPWPSIWDEVVNLVRLSPTRQDAVKRVSAFRGEPTTWDAIARASRRLQEAGLEDVPVESHLAMDYVATLAREGLDEINKEIERGQAEMSKPRTVVTLPDPSDRGYWADTSKWRLTPKKHLPVDRGPKHGIWGDTQIAAGDDLDYIRHIALYFADKRPDVVIQLGDWADMVSLSSYDSKAKKAVDERSVKYDFEIANEDWQMVDAIWAREGYNPRKVYVLGNHENRINRFVDDNPEFAGDVNVDRFVAKKLGWEVYPFLEVVTIDGVAYSHYFPRGPSGRVTQTKNGAPNAITMVKREMRSCTAGHMQGLDTAIYQTSERTMRGVILGSSYPKHEGYLSAQGNKHWRGVLLKHSVRDGDYDLCEVPLDYLEAKYG